MKNIVCPNCGQEIKMDESMYLEIVNQVKTKEFDKELEKRVNDLSKQKDLEFQNIKLEVSSNHEKEIAKLASTINELQNALSNKDANAKLELQKALEKKNEEIIKLTNDMKLKKSEMALAEDAIKKDYDSRIKILEEQVAYYKDLKAKMSTKMVGETLEQHCLIEFNKLRPLAFKNVYFEKDNNAKPGSKGDFIYREFDDNGVEVLSIMFEMKNECDTTATKHKNEDFFKELDKDRNEKNCEYAVLVSLLDIDNDVYNAGITDVSYQYEKMYVVRPQCFIPIITILRNAALRTLGLTQELTMYKEQNIDILHFEDNLIDFKNKFSRNYELASRQFDKAIDDIDATIKKLQMVKDGLLSSANNLRLANDKVQDVSIKKLTKDNPTMQEKFNQIIKQ